ncbi:MAG: type II secretion system protein [Gammaproteobacteria bacterium]|nr:type II secretion system protein [Gammaproteobacteria bacterium]
MMNKLHGFTLVELLMFIVITSILASTILLTSQIALQEIPSTHSNLLGRNIAMACIEGFVAERRTLGFSDAKLAAAAPVAVVNMPVTCTTGTPAGFTVSANITAATLNADTNFKTIQVVVSGLSSASISTIIADY